MGGGGVRGYWYGGVYLGGSVYPLIGRKSGKLPHDINGLIGRHFCLSYVLPYQLACFLSVRLKTA